MQADSIHKIVQRYFACLTKEPFEFQGVSYEPKRLIVSPLLLRGYTCPSHCGGCCHLRFTLDYLPSEEQPAETVKRVIEFNGRNVVIWSDMQSDNERNQCHNLNDEDGRCGIYEVRPFSCDFELIRTLASEDDARANVLTQKLFGRGWNMMRIDGGRGALCEMTPPTPETIAEVIRKLNRLKDWADHFGIETWADKIIYLIKQGVLSRRGNPYILNPYRSKKGFGR